MRIKNAHIGKLLQERGGFTMVPNEIWEARVDPTAKLIWCYLASKPSTWDSSRNNLARNLGISKDTVSSHVRLLAELKMLNFVDSKNGWTFELRSPDEWAPGLLPDRDEEEVDQNWSSKGENLALGGPELVRTNFSPDQNWSSKGENLVQQGRNFSPVKAKNWSTLKTSNTSSTSSTESPAPEEDVVLAQEDSTPAQVDNIPTQTPTKGQGPSAKAVFLAWCDGEEPLSKLKAEKRAGLADLVATMKVNGVPKAGVTAGVLSALLFGDRSGPKIKAWKADTARALEIIIAEEYADEGIILAKGKTKQDKEDEWYMEYADQHFKELTPALIEARKKQMEQDDDNT